MDECGTFAEKWLCNDFVLTLMDVLLSTLVIGPCVVGFWRGTWEYMIHFENQFPVWWCLYVSTALHLTFTLIRGGLIDRFNKGGTLYSVVSRCYIYVFAVCCAMQWRSTWQILEHHIGFDVRLVLAFTVPSLILLLVFRLFGNTLAPPYVIATDFKAEDVFDFPTMFKIPVKMNTYIVCDSCLVHGLYCSQCLRNSHTNRETAFTQQYSTTSADGLLITSELHHQKHQNEDED